MRSGPTVGLLLCVTGLGACMDAETEARLDIDVSPTPAAVGYAQVRVRLADAETEGDGIRVVIVGTLTGEREPQSVDTATALRGGLWVADSFPLPRAGEWRLEARAELEDGRVVVGSHSLRVVGM